MVFTSLLFVSPLLGKGVYILCYIIDQIHELNMNFREKNEFFSKKLGKHLTIFSLFDIIPLVEY